MKYQWLEINDMTCDELSAEIGIKICKITRGDIIVGYENDRTPIERNGVEIEFEGEPTKAQLEKLDAMMPELKRQGKIKSLS